MAVNYKHGGLDMAMDIKNMDKPNITIPDAPDNSDARVKIII